MHLVFKKNITFSHGASYNFLIKKKNYEIKRESIYLLHIALYLYFVKTKYFFFIIIYILNQFSNFLFMFITYITFFVKLYIFIEKQEITRLYGYKLFQGAFFSSKYSSPTAGQYKGLPTLWDRLGFYLTICFLIF